LIWQQFGSDSYLKFEDAKNWITIINQQAFAGFQDWRLPTVEEAMSLMEPKKTKSLLFIDPIFSKMQKAIWTNDLVKGKSHAWVVFFNFGYCSYNDFFYYNAFVRAVRSGQSSHE